MTRGDGLEYDLDDSKKALVRFLYDNQFNPAYQNCVHQDQMVLSWILASFQIMRHHK